ncbi:MAG: hypothetical protein L3J11_00995 [Draconibacterium sp.]|nr:hypothetical protein [Draconibacterium sp.]
MKQFGEWIWPDRQIRLMDISDKADPPDSELKLADILTDVGVGPTKQVMENPLRHVSLQQVG